jgi:Ca2+-binding EF-hand superfamily protein
MDLGEFRLARTLQHQAQSERKIDVIRTLLIGEPGFNSYNLFRFLASGKDFITTNDLTIFLQDNNFVITRQDAQQLVARYSKQSTISYQDFFVNLELPDLEFSNRGISSPRSSSAPVGHKVLLAHKMKTEVETNRNSTVLKELLAEELGSNFYSAFRSADSKRSGFLTIDDMAQILTKFSISLTEAELGCLVRKYDSNRDGRISYLEFLTQLMPEGRVDSLRTPYSSPARARITSSPNRSMRSPSRDTSRQQLSFDEADDDDNQMVPFNNNNLSVRSTNESYYSPNRSRTASAYRSPSSNVSAYRSPARTMARTPSRSSPAPRSPSIQDAVVDAKVQLESEFESLRQRLALHPSFTLLNAFKHLDSNNNGFISIGELRRCLTDAGYFPTPDELECCVRLFDSNGDGRISYAEFISKMMPTEAVYSELVSSPSAGGIRAERRLSIPCQLDLAKTLKARIEQEKEMEQINRTQMYAWNN